MEVEKGKVKVYEESKDLESFHSNDSVGRAGIFLYLSSFTLFHFLIRAWKG